MTGYELKEMSIVIRKGIREDVPTMFELVTELAIYEKAPEQVTNTVEQMYIDGFGENPIFGSIVAEVDGVVVGMSLYYYRYSTWKGKRLYLEDLIVSEKKRGLGLGEMLLNATIQQARDTSCTGLMWQVLDWNEPAINFYKKFGARFDEGWINVHIDF
jgi:GNAT superfamily N-acetyltransferase